MSDVEASLGTFEWEPKMREQRAMLARSAEERKRLRAAVEAAQCRIADLTSATEQLSAGDTQEHILVQRSSLLTRLDDARSHLAADTSLSDIQIALTNAEAAAGLARDAAEAAIEKTRGARTQLALFGQKADEASAAADATAERIRSMVTTARLHDCEAGVRSDREEVASAEREARQLRVALAEAISSGADLPNTLKELGILKDSAKAASQRIASLSAINAQLLERLERVQGETKQLQKGAVDLRSEGELMREVIVKQSELLVRRVEDLTDEHRTADDDRRHLLAHTANLMLRVDEAEARLARRPELEQQRTNLESTQQNLLAEVERLRRSNDDLCHQVLGEEGEGPFAGAFKGSSAPLSKLDEGLISEVSRLLRGHLPDGGLDVVGLQADAASLSLRLQQVIAEREECFWVERQRLSDRVTALERARGGRTGNLLREYGAAAQSSSGARPGATATTGYTAGAAQGAVAVAEKAAGIVSGAVSGGMRRLREAALDSVM